MLLDKEKASLIIKIVAIVISVAFVGSLIYTFAPNVNLGKKPSSTTKSTTADEEMKRQAAELEKILKDDPSNANAWVALGNIYFDLNQNEKAIEAYKKGLELNSKQPDVWSDLGTVYFRLQQYDQSIEQFKKAIEINPKHAKAFYNLGVVYRTKGNIPLAIEYWEKFIQIDPDSPNAPSIKQEIDSLKQQMAQTPTSTTTVK